MIKNAGRTKLVAAGKSVRIIKDLVAEGKKEERKKKEENKEEENGGGGGE